MVIYKEIVKVNTIYTAEQLNEIKMHLSVIQDCISMGGLAPYQADVISRRLNQALAVIKNGRELDNNTLAPHIPNSALRW